MTYPRCVTCKELIRTFGDHAMHNHKCKRDEITGSAKISYAKRYRK